MCQAKIDLSAYRNTRKTLQKAAETSPIDLALIQAEFKALPEQIQHDKADYFLEPVLTAAIQQADCSVLDWLLTQNIRQGHILNPPVYLAVMQGDMDILQALLKAELNINLGGLGSDELPDGKHPLLAAIQTRRVDMLKLLLQAGIEVNFVTRCDRSPLEMAQDLAFDEIVKELTSAGAKGLSDEELSLTEALKRRKWARACQLIPQTEDRALHKALTPLFEAADDEALTGICESLDDWGLSFALGQAARHNQLPWVQKFRALGARLNSLPGKPNAYWPDGWGDTPLVLAAERNHVDMVKYLLDAGADPNYTDKRKDTALHAAAKMNYVEVARLLLAAGADHKAKNDQRETPMAKAKAYWGKDIIPLLKQAGAKPRTPTGIARSAKKKLKAYERKAYLPKVKHLAKKSKVLDASHYGGQALCSEWPVCGLCKTALPCFLQLNLATLPTDFSTAFAQLSGLAQFFYCTRCQPFFSKPVFSTASTQNKGVFLQLLNDTEVKHAEAQFHPDPEKLFLFPEAFISGWSGPKSDFPWREYEIWEAIQLDAEEEVQAAQYNLTGDKLGGWPHWLQDSQTPLDSKGQAMLPLFQLDSGSTSRQLEYNWGDSGVASLFLSQDGQELAFVSQSL